MAKEISTKEDMLVWRLGQMAKENAELELRMSRLMDEYNCTADELSKLREREREASEKDELSEAHGGSGGKREGAARVTLGEMFQMRDHCDKLEKENRELERFAKAIHSFVKDKKLYMAKGANCQYYKDGPHVCSTFCLECKSCLGVIDGVGVICANKLVEARVSFPNND